MNYLNSYLDYAAGISFVRDQQFCIFLYTIIAKKDQTNFVFTFDSL